MKCVKFLLLIHPILIVVLQLKWILARQKLAILEKNVTCYLFQISDSDTLNLIAAFTSQVMQL